MSTQTQYESYIESLKRQRKEREEERYVGKQQSKALTDQISEWWATVPADEKGISYSMDFFVNRFGATRQKLGLALFSLGWERRRRWEPGKPHSRYWVKQE